jgi:hypothetical protein
VRGEAHGLIHHRCSRKDGPHPNPLSARAGRGSLSSLLALPCTPLPTSSPPWAGS